MQVGAVGLKDGIMGSNSGTHGSGIMGFVDGSVYDGAKILGFETQFMGTGAGAVCVRTDGDLRPHSPRPPPKAMARCHDLKPEA